MVTVQVIPRNTTLLVRAFVTYIRPLLEYCSVVLYGLPTTKVIPCQLNKCRDVLRNVCMVYENCHMENVYLCSTYSHLNYADFTMI